MLSRSAVIALLAFLTLIDLFGAQALLPSLAEEFAVDPATMGSAVNASTFGMAVAGMLVAFFSRNIDRRKGVWISLAVLSLPTLLLGFVDDITLFTALRVVQGMLMATAFTLTMAYLAEECSGPEAATAMAAYITGNVVSNLLGRLMAATFADLGGVFASFWAFAALNLVGAFLAARCLSQTAPREATGPVKSPFTVWRMHLGNHALQAGFAIGFVIFFIFLGVFTYVNFVLAGPLYDLSPAQLGLVYFVFIPSVLTTPMAAWLASSGGTYRAFFISMSVATIGLIMLITGSLLLLLIGLSAVGVGTFCAQAIVSSFIGRAAEEDRAAASGLYLTSYYLGGLIGSLVVGAVFASAGWTSAVLLMVAAAFLSVLFALRLKPVHAAA